MSARIASFASLAAASLIVAACGGGSSTSVPTVAPQHHAAAGSGCKDVPKPSPKSVHLKAPKQTVQKGQKLSATVATSCGAFTIDLDTSDSPKTVNSFVYLAKQGVFDNTDFHRVVPGFVIQGGDPQLSGQGGPGYTVVEPPPQNTSYRRAAVAMAKASNEPKGASGSQFFVVTAPSDAGLTPDYALLGKVSSGMSTVERIASLADPSLGAAGGEPVQPIVIDSVTVR